MAKAIVLGGIIVSKSTINLNSKFSSGYPNRLVTIPVLSDSNPVVIIAFLAILFLSVILTLF